jgi:hypothetical protein
MANAKKALGPVTIVDEDGYETDGMFRWNGPKIPYSPDLLERWADDVNRCLNLSASERIAELRERVTVLIQPFVVGPYPPDDVDRYSENLRGCTITFLNLSTGSGTCGIQRDIRDGSYVKDGVSALHALDELTALLSKKPLRIDRIVRSAIEIGSRIAKAELRAYFAQAVLATKKRRPGVVKGGKSRAKWTETARKLAIPMMKELRRSKMSASAIYEKVSARLLAEHCIDLSARTISRHLPLSSLDKA